MKPDTLAQGFARQWARTSLGVATLACVLALCGCSDKPAPRAEPPAVERMSADDAALKAQLPQDITPENHSMVMDAILGKPKHPIRQIGILVYDGVNDLDFTGPRYILGQSGATTRLIGVKPGPIKTVMGVQVIPDTVIDEVKQLEGITVASVLSHTAGLPWFPPDSGIQLLALVDWERCTSALAAMKPLWTPATAYQYHSATHGHLTGEIVRRVSGKSLGRFFSDEVAKPLGLDFWIGLPLSEEKRVAPIFNSHFAEHPFIWFMNLREALAAEIPSGNGVANARSMARMYAALMGEVDGLRLWRRDTLERARVPQTDALPLVPYPSFLHGLYAPAFGQGLPPPLKQRFALGYELPYEASPMLGDGSFGQPGMGGRIGFAHPDSGTAVGYVCNNTTWNAYAGPDPRWVPWLEALQSKVQA